MSEIPFAWRALMAQINASGGSGRISDGEPGIRDVDAPCGLYEPEEVPMDAEIRGDCETDGHYLCAEGTTVCAHISARELWRRRDRCEGCGGELGPGDTCEACDQW